MSTSENSEIKIKKNKDFDFIVIGGGICGLQIAALCSKLGRVLVIEKTSHLGGRARVVNHKGFKLEWGPHPVRYGKKSALSETMKELNAEIEFIDPGLSYIYVRKSNNTNDTNEANEINKTKFKKYIFPSGVKGILKTKLISKLELARILLYLHKLYGKDEDETLSMSFNEFYERYERDKGKKISSEAKIFFKTASASMQVNPFMDISSVGEFYENILRVFKNKSVFYPKGGWEVFFQTLIKQIKSNGKIAINSEVKKIILKKINQSDLNSDTDKDIQYQAVGVEIGEKSKIIFGKNIISAIPVQQLVRIIPQSAINSFLKDKLSNLKPSSGVSIDYCLKRKITDDTLVFIDNPPSFGLIPTNLSPEIAPENGSIMSFFLPVEPSQFDTKAKRRELLKSFKSTIFSIYPELASDTANIIYERPLFLDMVDGVQVSVNQHRKIRPKPSDFRIKNFYATGDSIGGEGAGGDIGHTSVRECFIKIKEYLGK